ncbi:hypothetical protein PIB30_066475 [Stylosanthes scabra]|uniref:Uncharacterized protein n=1 Tax=Stylosanthes scabra TaxID=79078 RepID=A0ABU6YJV8_9FABA|nr:hypothetical protein [Stylosanthes scabra]
MRTHPIRGRHAQKGVLAQMRTHSELLCHSGSSLTVRGSPRQHGTSAWEPGDSRTDPIRGSIFRSRARGPCDSRIVPVTAGYSWEPGTESRTPSNTCSKCELNPELWVRCYTLIYCFLTAFTAFNLRTTFEQTQLQPTPIKNILSLSLPEQNDPSLTRGRVTSSTKNASATPSPSIQSALEIDNSNKEPPPSRKRKALEPKYGHINSKEFDHLVFAQEYLLGGNSRIPMDGENFLKNFEAVTRSSIKAAAICHAAHNKMKGCVVVPEGEVEKLRSRVKVVEAEKREIEGERSELSSKVTRLEAQIALETQDLKDTRELLKKVEKEKSELDEKCRRLYAKNRLKVEDQKKLEGELQLAQDLCDKFSNDAMLLAEEVAKNLKEQLRILVPEFDVNQIGPNHKVIDGVVVPPEPPADVKEHTAVDDIGDQTLPDGNANEEEEPTPITVVLPEVQLTMSDPPPTPPC